MSPIFELFCVFASIFSLTFSVLTHPARMSCPPGWFAEGVPPSGAFTCHRPPPCLPIRGSAACDERLPTPPGRIEMRVRCTGGTVPVLAFDGRTVGCQRGPSSWTAI